MLKGKGWRLFSKTWGWRMIASPAYLCGKSLSLCSALGNSFTQVAKLNILNFTPAGPRKGSVTAFMVLFHWCPHAWSCELVIKVPPILSSPPLSSGFLLCSGPEAPWAGIWLRGDSQKQRVSTLWTLTVVLVLLQQPLSPGSDNAEDERLQFCPANLLWRTEGVFLKLSREFWDGCFPSASYSLQW